MSADKEIGPGEASGGFGSSATSWLTSFAGITTAVATIMTSCSALLGLVVHHQAAQLQQAHATVSQQAVQIHVLKKTVARQSVSTASAAPVAASSPSDAPLTSVAHYLSDLSPTVDNGALYTGQQVIAAQPYAKSILFYCNGGSGAEPDEAYDVAGSSTFTAMAGIPDNMQNATDVIATITFSNESGQQIGTPIQVSLGHPVKVRLSIGGVTQLGVTCNGRNARTSQATSSFAVALGDAGVS
jgi:hypothetical protein